MVRTSESGIHLYAHGEAFKDGKFDLRALELILSNYRMIIDHALPLVIGHKTLTERIRNEIKYEVEVRNGSLELILQFILEHPELLVILSADSGYTFSETINKIINGAIELRRVLTRILENSLRPTIHIDQSMHIDNRITHNIQTGDIHLTNPQFIVAADMTKAPFDRLIRGIDGAYVSDINIVHEELATHLSVNDHDITGAQKEELASNIEVIGRLDMAAFTSHRGHIITGGKRYPVIWDEQLRAKIRMFVDIEGIHFRVRPIVDHRLFRDEPIGFHVIDCWEPQVKMNL